MSESPDEPSRRAGLITLGCARNDVDSSELGGRLAAQGWELGDDLDDADVIVVNTCGFIAQAKKDSIDTILAAADTGRPVVAVGCLAERYGAELAEELPEATVLSFDDYPDISDRLADAIAGVSHPAHTPRDRRRLLPLAPVDRAPAAAGAQIPGHAPTSAQRLLSAAPSQSVKLASGCDRRCTFCAIPQFRGAFVSRPPEQIVDEVAVLARRGAREVVLVSENSTSYGKDLGDLRLLEKLLADLALTPELAWLRVSYLQPAEMRPDLVSVIGSTPGVARYFDMSFQHAAGDVLRRMRRFGDGGAFLELIARIRAVAPEAGIRSNFIVGFPQETEADVAQLCDFLIEARLDAIGVFGYSDEDGTAAVDLPGHLDDDEVAARVTEVAALADTLMAQRAEDRLGAVTDMLVERVAEGVAEGRCEHQGPDDAATVVHDATGLSVGDVVQVRIVGDEGLDLVAVTT